MIDIAEQICEAVDKIVTERMKGIKYDTTVTATIVDDSHANQYYYTVSTGEAQFVAFAAENTYKNDDSVLVTIPNNDYDQQKIIIGKNINKEDKEPYRYIKPFNTLVNVSGNIIGKIDKVSLLANGTEKEQVLIWTWDAKTSDLSLDGYTRIGLQGQFSSWLEEFNAIIGDYGYKLVITSERDEVIGDSPSKDAETGNESSGETDTLSPQAEGDATVETIFYLSSVTDMIGNPYRFSAYHEQEKVFDISDLGKILEIELYFYQKPNSFFDANGNLVPNKDTLENLLFDNLFTKDSYICFGYDVNEFENEAAFLYSINSSTYNRTCTIEENEKVINLRWIHRYEDGSLGVVTELPTNYTIKWYRYRLGAPSADQYSGVYWEDVTPKDENNNIINSFLFTLNPDTNRDIEQIKAIVYKADESDKPDKPVVRSNVITFVNEDEVVNNATIDAIQGLNFVFDDDSNGNYLVYGQNGQIFDNQESRRLRTITIQLKDKDGKFTDVTEAESIVWNYPKNNSMLIIQEPVENSNSLSYTINSQFNATDVNNTISCTVIKNGRTYFGTIPLYFNLMGTNGTDATLVIRLDKEALDISKFDSIDAKLSLYDQKYKLQDLTPWEKNIQWSLWGYKYNDQDKKWEYQSGQSFHCQYFNIGLDQTTLRQTAISIHTKSETAQIPQEYCLYLKATLEGFGDYTLEVNKPIAVTIDNSTYCNYVGPSEIIYNTLGYADYFKSSIKLKNIKNEIWEPKIKIGTPVPNDEKYHGIISNGILKPLHYYVKNASPYSIIIKDGETIVWNQPLLITQNLYPSTTINKWNGTDLILDEKNSSVVATNVSAGSKDDQNRFSGIMMGDLKTTNSDESITQKTGLYGFHQGAVSFAFKEDGTAFIGKSGKGRIHFDGTNSTIKSELWDQNETGLCIDLDDGVLEFKTAAQYEEKKDLTEKEFNKNPEQYYLKNIEYNELDINEEYNSQLIYYTDVDENGIYEVYEPPKTGIPKNWNTLEDKYYKVNNVTQDNYENYFIYDKETNTYIQATEYNEQTTYYAQSKDRIKYYTQSINYQNQKNKKYNINGDYYTAVSDSKKYITLSSKESTYPLSIGRAPSVTQRNFRVDWDGTCYINNGEFSGDINGSSISGSSISGGYISGSIIEAEQGKIGGWNITKTALENVSENKSLILNATSGIQLTNYLNGITLKNSTMRLPYIYEEIKNDVVIKTTTGHGTFGIKDGNGVDDTGPAIETYVDGEENSYRTRFIAGFNHIGMAYNGGGYISIDKNGVSLNEACMIDTSGNITTTGTINNATIESIKFNGVTIQTVTPTGQNSYTSITADKINDTVINGTIINGTDLKYAYFA